MKIFFQKYGGGQTKVNFVDDQNVFVGFEFCDGETVIFSGDI